MSDPSIPDRVRTGTDLLERIRELTYRDWTVCGTVAAKDLLLASADELDRERQHVAALEEALRPMARAISGVLDNWPGECVLTWEERQSHPKSGLRGEPYGCIGYLGANVGCSGVTIAEYRQAAALLAEE